MTIGIRARGDEIKNLMLNNLNHCPVSSNKNSEMGSDIYSQLSAYFIDKINVKSEIDLFIDKFKEDKNNLIFFEDVFSS